MNDIKYKRCSGVSYEK